MPSEFTSLKQADVKKYLPDGAYIWKNRHAGVWCTRLPPFKENRSRRGDPDSSAIRKVVGIVWRQWCDVEAVAYEECPMQGIDFDALSA